jgi:hypothetical protein
MRVSLAGALAVSAGCLALCAPASADVFSWTPDTLVGSTGSPFGSTAAGAACQRAPGQTGVNYPGTQVEPWLAVSPADPDRQIAIWQQDRWSDGGANGLISAYTTDGGASWIQPAVSAQPAFSNCTGGTGETGGYTRASDPWVSFGPDGTAWAMALQADIGFGPANAMSVARTTDGGATWDAPVLLRRDTSPNVLNDKNSLTVDRFDADYVYAIWDRLEFPNARAAAEAGEHAIGYRGPTWFARRTPSGWGDAHEIYDPGAVNQTIGNQIVQTGTGKLVDGFNLIFNVKNAHKARGYNIAVLRSEDHGATWSGAKRITGFTPGTVSDPTTGAPVRTGDIIPEIAADPRPGSDTVYLVWQERGPTGLSRIMFTESADAGDHWSDPVTINTDTSTPAFTPSIDVAPNGTVTVTYYDFRHDTATASLETDTWAVHRHAGETAWSESHVDGPFDMAKAANARGYFVGDYEGLDAGEGDEEGSSVFSSARVMAGITGAATSETYGNTATTAAP